MIQWPEQSADPAFSPASWGVYGAEPMQAPTFSPSTAFGGDSISTFSPNVFGNSDASDGAPSIFANLFAAMEQFFGGAANGIGNWFSGTTNDSSEQYFSTASGGSNGDPHISFNGTTWNDMQSEPDLLNSQSIRGGYQLSTQTTAPNAGGVTYNQSATVTTHAGRTAVTLDNNGTATITQDGATSTLAAGQTAQLGNEVVTCNANGSLQIVCRNNNGGQITTTMTQNGSGVDVNVSANNVDLGGAMVNGSSNGASQSLPTPRPVMHRYEGDLSEFV